MSSGEDDWLCYSHRLGSQTVGLAMELKYSEILLDAFSDGPCRMLIDSVPVFVYLKDTENRNVRVNKVVADSLGETVEAIEGSPTSQWYPELASQYYEDDLEVIKTGKPKKGIVEPHNRTGGITGWIETDKYPVWGPNREVSGVLVVARDITDREHFRELLYRAARVESIGHTSAAVAHDLNNLFTIIQGHLDIMTKESIDKRLGALGLNEARRGIDVAVNAVQRILEPARRKQDETTIVDLNTLTTDVHRLLSAAVPDGVTFSLDLAQGELRSKCKPMEISEALINLILNGWDAMPWGGNLIISTERYVPGGEHHICVKDNGVGIPRQNRAKIFAPNFSTKGRNGSGLGLAIAEKLVRQSDGKISLDPDEGNGSVFRICLPNQ